jgi:hypothetical protein
MKKKILEWLPLLPLALLLSWLMMIMMLLLTSCSFGKWAEYSIWYTNVKQ